MEDALYDSQALRGFAGIDLTMAAVPDETTILNFRHWLESHELSQALFAEVSAMLEERGLLMRQEGAQSSMPQSSPPRPRPKTRARVRDPEMHQTKKGNQWHFGMPFDKPRSAYRGRCRLGTGAHGRRYRRQRSRHQSDGGSAARRGGGCLRRCRLYRSRQAARTCGPRCLLEHRNQAKHHQSIAERPAGFGGACRASAIAGAGLGRAPLPHRQEPSLRRGRLCSATRSCAIAASRRTLRNCTLCSPWPTW